MSRALRRGGVHLDARRARAYLDTVDERVMVAVEFAFDLLAPRAEAYAKANAPWTDRTALARASLTATVDVDGRTVALTVAHGVSYGIYLETMQDGRFAVVEPTQAWAARQAPREVAAMINRALEVG